MSSVTVPRGSARLWLAALAAAAWLTTPAAQIRFTYSTGQTVSPAYEGWMPTPNGFAMYFGYMNTNWLEEFDVPIGPDNAIEPGGPDQGQPTHFYPRRSPFLFTVNVPKEMASKELIWTLTTHGRTEKAYASLKTDYQIDNQVISTEVGGDFGSLRDELRTNRPPELGSKGRRSGARRSAKRSRSSRLPAIPTTCRRGGMENHSPETPAGGRWRNRLRRRRRAQRRRLLRTSRTSSTGRLRRSCPRAVPDYGCPGSSTGAAPPPSPSRPIR